MLQNPSQDLNCAYFIDEIAPFIPAGSEKPIPKPILKLLFKQARKYGVGCLIATQNPGDIDYKAFAQFGSWAIGRLTVKQDQKKVENALKSISSVDISRNLPSLKPGNFLLFSPDISDSIIKLKVRWLYTQHKTLTDLDVKKVTSQNIRDYYRPFLLEKKIYKKQTAPETEGEDMSQDSEEAEEIRECQKEKEHSGIEIDEEKVIEGDEKHFRLMVGESEILELIEKNKKKHFMIGPSKEDLVGYNLILKPLYWAQVTTSTNNLLKKVKHEQNDMIIDAKGGEIVLYRRGTFSRIYSFSKLLDLNENEIIILRYLTEKRNRMFAADISIKTRISKAAVTKSMKTLLRKKLVTYEKIGRDNRFFSIIDLPEINIIQVKSDQPLLTKKKLKATVGKASINIKNVEKAVKSWFNDSLIVGHELIYLPVYVIRYSGKHGIRKVEINGVTGKNIASNGY